MLDFACPTASTTGKVCVNALYCVCVRYSLCPGPTGLLCNLLNIQKKKGTAELAGGQSEQGGKLPLWWFALVPGVVAQQHNRSLRERKVIKKVAKCLVI